MRSTLLPGTGVTLDESAPQADAVQAAVSAAELAEAQVLCVYMPGELVLEKG